MKNMSISGASKMTTMNIIGKSIYALAILCSISIKGWADSGPFVFDPPSGWVVIKSSDGRISDKAKTYGIDSALLQKTQVAYFALFPFEEGKYYLTMVALVIKTPLYINEQFHNSYETDIVANMRQGAPSGGKIEVYEKRVDTMRGVNIYYAAHKVILDENRIRQEYYYLPGGDYQAKLIFTVPEYAFEKWHPVQNIINEMAYRTQGVQKPIGRAGAVLLTRKMVPRVLVIAGILFILGIFAGWIKNRG